MGRLFAKYGNKYETSYQRRSHFDSEMKFAHAKAESKAYLKTTRVVVCLPASIARPTSGKSRPHKAKRKLCLRWRRLLAYLP